MQYISHPRVLVSLFCEAVNGMKTAESLQFGLGTIKAATDNFSEENKLGQGGFGYVYKEEAIVDDFLHLKTQSYVFEAETMVEGTIEGFPFDYEEETDEVTKATAHQTDQNVAEPAKGKTKRTAAKRSVFFPNLF